MTSNRLLWHIVRHCEHFVIINSAITLVEIVCNDLMVIFALNK